MSPDPAKTPSRRTLSRPARLRAIQADLQTLQAEYQQWLEALPDALADGDLADRLADTIEQLEEASELIDAIELPRGFGRD